MGPRRGGEGASQSHGEALCATKTKGGTPYYHNRQTRGERGCHLAVNVCAEQYVCMYVRVSVCAGGPGGVGSG